mmetsp:Transcript_20384/g.56495  ORF Transcript_20384/g.56495 Transcript_20384/m.56495 type:complete len:490 (-) Transcript_20384:540-2009(-)
MGGLVALRKQLKKESPSSLPEPSKGSKLASFTSRLSSLIKTKPVKSGFPQASGAGQLPADLVADMEASFSSRGDDSVRTASSSSSYSLNKGVTLRQDHRDATRPSSVFVEMRPELKEGATPRSEATSSVSSSTLPTGDLTMDWQDPADAQPGAFASSSPPSMARIRRPRHSSVFSEESRPSFAEQPRCESEERLSLEQRSRASSLYSLDEAAEHSMDSSNNTQSSSTNTRSRRSSLECPASSKGSLQPGSQRAASRSRPSSLTNEGLSTGTDAGTTWDAVYEAKEMMASEWYTAAARHRPASEISETNSWLSRSETDVPVERVLTSSLYSEQGMVPVVPKEQRTRSAADDTCTTSFLWASIKSDQSAPRGCRSAELVREIKQSKLNQKEPKPEPPRPPQGYVDELTLEEEARAIVSPSTCLTISRDGIKYRTLAGTKGIVDAHAPLRAQAANAQLARLAFNLPSVRDAEHQRCRNELRLSSAAAFNDLE